MAKLLWNDKPGKLNDKLKHFGVSFVIATVTSLALLLVGAVDDYEMIIVLIVILAGLQLQLRLTRGNSNF